MPKSQNNLTNPNELLPNQEMFTETEQGTLYFFRNSDQLLFSCLAKNLENAQTQRKDWQNSLRIEELQKGEETYHWYFNKEASEDRIHYYYRETTGELFHCETTSLEIALKHKKQWQDHVFSSKLLQLSPEQHKIIESTIESFLIAKELRERSSHTKQPNEAV